MSTLSERIDVLLPQTQCGRCGYPGCRPYAEALARDEVDLNRCPPGGRATIEALAALLDRPARPLDPACGEAGPPTLAVIDESACIGCTRCIQACPVDAIVGAPRLMHTVIGAECTGCERCLPPCPVDCIDLVPDPQPWTRARADQARSRYEAQQQRLARLRRERHARLSARRDTDDRRKEIAAAVARVRARRGRHRGPVPGGQ